MFSIFAQKIESGYTFEKNLCFRAKIRKNIYPCKPQFHFIKWEAKGYKLHMCVNMMRLAQIMSHECR